MAVFPSPLASQCHLVHSHPTFSKNLAKETAHALNSILQPEFLTPFANICYNKLRGCCGLLQSQQQNLFPEFITWDLQCCFYWAMGERGSFQARTVPSASQAYSPCHGATFHVDISMAWRLVSTLLGMWAFRQNLHSPVQEFPGLAEQDLFAFSWTGIYSRGLQVEEKKFSQSDSLSTSSIWRLQGNLHCKITFVFIYFTIYLGFKVVLTMMIMVSRLEKRKHLCNQAFSYKLIKDSVKSKQWAYFWLNWRLHLYLLSSLFTCSYSFFILSSWLLTLCYNSVAFIMLLCEAAT